MKLVTESFRKLVEEKVAEMEKKAGVQFVPVIIPQSAGYRSVRFLWAAVTVIVLLLTLLMVDLPGTRAAEIGVVFVVGILVYALASFEPVLYALTPAAQRAHAVEEEAYRIFLKEEIFATRRRVGILILVSLLERSVFVLADRGLSPAVKNEEWQRLAQSLARDFDRKNPGQSFILALEKLAERLAPQFPPDPSDGNELSDRLRERRGDKK